VKLLSTRLLSVGASLALLVALAAPASADYVKLKDGTLVKGEATSYDEAADALVFKMEDGSTRSIPMADLNHRSVYLVNRSRIPRQDFEGQLKIGNLARDVELFAHAMRHYGYARKADAARGAEVDAEVARLKSLAAEWAMQKAKDAVSKGDIREAEKWLVKLVEKVPDEPQAVQAQQMLDEYYARNREQREAETLARATEQQHKQLEVAKRHYDDMTRKAQKGLTSKRTGNTSVSAWERALKDGERTLSALGKVDTTTEGAVTAEQLEGYRRMVTEEMIEIHLHLASLWTVRSSYNKALGETNKALALDPSSERAIAARARVERAASERRGILW